MLQDIVVNILVFFRIVVFPGCCAVNGDNVAQFSLLRDGVLQAKNIMNWRLHLTKGDNVFTLQYGYPVPTGLDDKKAEKRYTKVVRDGKIYIERNGEWFNVLGAQVR